MSGKSLWNFVEEMQILLFITVVKISVGIWATWNDPVFDKSAQLIRASSTCWFNLR